MNVRSSADPVNSRLSRAARVAARDAGRPTGRAVARPQLIDEYLAKVAEWVELSAGKVRDKPHAKLVALGYEGATQRAWTLISRCRRRPALRGWVSLRTQLCPTD